MSLLNFWKIVVGFLICISPIYWFYNVDVSFISNFKKLTFAAAYILPAKYLFSIVILKDNKKPLIAFYFLILFVLCVIYLSDNYKYLYLIYTAVFIMWSFFLGQLFAAKSQVIELDILGNIASIFFTFLSFLIIIAWIFPNFNPINPNLVVDQYTVNIPYLSYTAFAQSRTHWTAVFIVFLGIAIHNYINNEKIYQLMIIVLLLASIVILSTKSGMILGISLILYIFLNVFRKRPFLTTIVFFIVSFGLFYLFSNYASLFRLNDLLSGDLDQISTGRTTSFTIGIKYLADQLFFGEQDKIFTLQNLGFNYRDVHNVLINYTIKFGLICSAPFFLMILFLVRPVLSGYYSLPLGEQVLKVSILFSLLTGLWEPISVYSYNHYGFSTWFFLGVISRKNCFAK